MLKLLRKYSRSWFIAIAIGAIVVVFVLWGVGSFQSARLQEVASVNGAPILLPAFIRQYNDLMKQYQEQARGEMTEEMAKALHLKEQALGRLIDEELLRQAAARLGIGVSDEELRAQIQGYPYFQVDGRFNERVYYQMLGRVHLSPEDFEKQERHRLIVQKLVQEVTSFAKVSDGELQELFNLTREAVQVNYLVTSPEPYVAKQRVSDAEAGAYFKDHQAEFKTPERVQVRYVLVRPQELLEQVRLSPSQIDDYLQEHAAELVRPKVIRVRQLFLPLPSPGGPAEQSRLAAQAQDLLRQAQTGKDFARLGDTLAQNEESRRKSGDLGYLTRGQNLPEWEKVAFSLRAGQVGLARTPQGFYLIKVEEVKETEKLPDAETKAIATQALKQEKSLRLAQDKAKEVRSELAAGASMAEVAKKHGLTPKDTPLFALTEALPGLGRDHRFNQAALKLKPREVSPVVEVSQGFAVLQGLEHRPATEPALEQVKDLVAEAVKRQKAGEQAAQDAGRWLERLRRGEPLTQVAAQAGLPIEDSGFFTRFQGFKNQFQAQALTSAAFGLSAQNPYPAKVLPWQEKYYLLAFKARRLPPASEFEKERENLRKSFLEQKRELIFTSWLTAERQQAKIKIYEIPS
jgi:peptidyl-prolyl cis-trans isomerase D